MMKKTLVALAVLGASGLVAAQSSVTLYGIADAGIGRVKNKALGYDTKTSFMGGNHMVNNSPSRIGLKGTEDIGGGNVVGFTFEAGLSLEDGRDIEFSGAPNCPLFDTSTGRFCDRDANVFFAGGWGAFKAGRQVTATHIAEYAYDLTGLANYSVMRGTYAATGLAAWADAALAYVTPNMGGFQAAVAFISKNNLGTDYNVWDLGAWYNNGALGVGASVNKGLDDGKTNYQLGAKYGFGNFTVAASYHNASCNIGINCAAGAVAGSEPIRRGFGLGAQAKFGAFTVTLDLTRDTKNEWGVKKYTNALLEGKYSLSKRTFFYGDVLRLDGNTHWGLGIQHQF
ncbi:MAG: porin [Ottowia sp.]|nr:porin [Ottowia sp.]